MELFVSQQSSPHTQRAYAADLRRFEAFVQGREITDELIVEWRDSLSSELSNAAALRVFTTARSYFKWAEIEPNPFLRIKPPRRIEGMTPSIPAESEVDKVMNACHNPVHRGILSLLNNGLRAQEVVDLSVSDFFFDEGSQAYILRVTGKGNKMRLVPATDETIESLTSAVSTSTGPLFPQLNTRHIYYLVEKYARLAKVEGMHPHAFRHSYATRLTRAGVDVLTLQKLLGHARPETTSIYVNLDLSDLVRAARLDPRRAERPALRIVS